MKKLKRILAMATMIFIVSAGAFGQKKGEEPKRPPKDADNKVVVKEKPPQNTNQGSSKSEKKP